MALTYKLSSDIGILQTVFEMEDDGSFYLSGPVHTTQEEFENEVSFLRLGLLSTLIRGNCPPKTELFENALKNGGN